MLKNKKLIVIVVAVVAVLAIAIAVLFGTGVLGNNDNTDENKTTENTTENTSENNEEDTTNKSPYDLIGIDGKVYPVIFDKDGKPTINDKNQVNVLVRDEKGELVTNENGEPETAWEQIDTEYITKDILSNKYYTINVVEGWEILPSGYIMKEGSDKKCFITIKAINAKGFEDKPLSDLLAELETREEKANKNFERNGFTVKTEKKDITITDKKIPAVLKTKIIHNKNGGLTDYSETIYFELEGNNKFAIVLTCADETGLKAMEDAKFDIVDYINKNLKLS